MERRRIGARQLKAVSFFRITAIRQFRSVILKLRSFDLVFAGIALIGVFLVEYVNKSALSRVDIN
jgi:hypothetical protein